MKCRDFTILVLIVLISSTLFSCTDTCNKKLGDTFNAVEVKNATINTTNQNISLVFKTSTLSDLPEQYFKDVGMFDMSLVDTVFATSEEIEIVLKSTETPQLNNTRMYKFQLNFGDRRTYIDCKHPGMADSYQLNLDFELENNNSNFEILNFTWQEFHSAGAI